MAGAYFSVALVPLEEKGTFNQGPTIVSDIEEVLTRSGEVGREFQAKPAEARDEGEPPGSVTLGSQEGARLWALVGCSLCRVLFQGGLINDQ